MNQSAQNAKLAVVIPTLGRETLVQTLESLTAARGFENLEIFVVGVLPEGPVKNRVAELCAAHPQIRVMPVAYPTGDSSRKKNAGFEAARTEIVAFLDDDVVVTPDWPEQIAAPFKDPAVGLVSGPALIPEDTNRMGRLAGLALASRAAGYVAARYAERREAVRAIRWSRIIGCNMAYRREVFDAVGHFDPAFWPGEEMIAAWKAQQWGYRVVFASKAPVYHCPRQTLRGFLRQVYGYGATRVRLLRAGVEFEPTTVIPALWVLSLVLLGVGAFFSGFLRALLILDLALYIAADAWMTWDKFLETKRAGDLLLFFLIPLMHLAYGVAEWVEFFRPNRDLSEKGPQQARSVP